MRFHSVWHADVNSDGDLDLVVANRNADSVSVLLGTGNPSILFAPRIDIPVGRGPSDVVIEDINGDGFLDILVANFFSDDISVIVGDGSGAFIETQRLLSGMR